MNIRQTQINAKVNFSRYRPDSNQGFYESYFIRANHPNQKQAFWMRYTLFIPKEKHRVPMGELWAVYFDRTNIIPYKEELPLHHCQFPSKHFYVQLGNNTLNSANAQGQIEDLSWDLHFTSQEKPLFLLPQMYYHLPFPKAKSIVSQPFAKFNGILNLGKQKIEIDNWIGSQNHNWGSEHTDTYAWGQVAGFDNSTTTFLELITAKVNIKGLSTPFLTLLVLRHRQKEYRLNQLSKAIFQEGSFDYFTWDFECEDATVLIKGRIEASASAFVGLRYYNPSGGDKNCLNSKVATCSLSITNKTQRGNPEALYTKHRCAFEILTNDEKDKHGIAINF